MVCLNEQTIPRARVVLLLIVLTLIAACLRFRGLGTIYVTRDESFSWRLIQYNFAELIKRTGADVHPPLYYLCLKCWAGLWGSSIGALRSMSSIFGVASVPMMYLATIESLHIRNNTTCQQLTITVKRASALFGAAIVALHSDHIAASQSARMYNLGVFLVLMSSWLILRALRGTKGQYIWWTAYGASAALLCYTHYFGAFSFVGQVAFASIELTRRRKCHFRSTSHAGILGLICAISSFLALYAIWIPTVLEQVHAVHKDFWIPPVTLSTTSEVMCSWLTGLRNQPSSIETWGAWAILGTVLLATTWKWHPTGILFLCQAMLPWLLCIGISTISGRSILQDRYLICAQVALFGTFVVLVVRTAAWLRPVIIGFIGSTTICGTVEYLGQLYLQPPAVVYAMDYLKENSCADDLVIASSQRTINRLRYYAAQSHIHQLNIRCVTPSGGRHGLIAHLASLNENDFISAPDIAANARRRVWYVFDEREERPPPLPDAIRPALRARFEGNEGTTYYVFMYR